MFDNLSERLERSFKILKGEGKITEINVAETLKDVRRALLDADVNYKVAKTFTDTVKQKALGQNVLTAVKPSQLMVKIVHDELATLMGGETAELNLQGHPSVILMAGLNGAGKTTLSGKLALMLKTKKRKNPLLAACDIYRPAAIEQLKVLGEQIGIPVYSEPDNKDAVQIAQNAVKAAKAKGYDVVIVDNLSNSDIAAVEGVRRITGTEIPFVEADCCDRDAFARVFEKYDFDSVIHFAASKAVGESVQKPLEYYGNNLTSFMNVISLMREFGRRNIVFSSSCTVYGEPDKQPVTERTPRKPATSPYGNTKQMAEDILHDCCAAYEGLHGIALRYFNPIGAHPSALIGELPRGVPQNLVPYITQTAAGIRECLSVFGDDYPTPDGSNIRDYIDVVDLAKAHVAAIRRGVSVLELVHRFEQVNRLKLNYKIVGRRAGDIVAIWADPSYANNELGWRAERSLDETLAAAWKWEKHIRGIE